MSKTIRHGDKHAETAQRLQGRITCFVRRRTNAAYDPQAIAGYQDFVRQQQFGNPAPCARVSFGKRNPPTT